MRAQPPTIAGELRLTVAPEDSSSRWGNPGFEVLSTPAILGHIERFCAELQAPHLDAGELTVGVSVSMNHRAPARVGDEVVITVSGPHTGLRFEVRDVHGKVLCDGVHGRAVVDADRFRARVGG
jgi:fluoroacetyl-CoA thioesterase